MSIPVRTGTDELIPAVVYALNELRKLSVSTNFHYSKTVERAVWSGPKGTPTVTDCVINAANASDLATSLTLCKEIRANAIMHLKDAVAHKVNDTTISGIAAEPTDLATGITCANSIKSLYETHRASTTFHANADATNTITSANATDQTSLNTLLNELKTDINAHTAGALGGYSLRLVDP